MAKIYDIGNGNEIILYAVGNQLLLRMKNKDILSRPSLLCNDFYSNPSSCVYRDVVYYGYINKENSLTIRSIYSQSSIYEVKAALDPTLYTFNNQLFLFYIQYDTGLKAFRLSCDLPLQETQHLSLTLPCESCPRFAICPCSDKLYIILSNDDYNDIYVFDSHLKLSDSISQASSSKTARIYEKKLRHLEEKLSGLEESLGSLTSANESLKAQLAKKEAALIEEQQRLQSAIRQYNNLMEVATQYKNEAIKWHNKFVQ